MEFSTTEIFAKNYKAIIDDNVKLIINEGGTSSSKTYSVIQVICDFLSVRTEPFLMSIVSESFPHLKMGCMRDFKDIMGACFDDRKWNASNSIYTFAPGVLLEFFSADQPGKAAGPRRDGLYINEVNNVKKSIVDQLSIRTRKFEIYDFNPTHQFWVHDLKDNPGVVWIHSTYLDAKHVLPRKTVEKIEAKRETDPSWWRVYGLGLVGNIEGLIHPSFETCDDMPLDGGVEVFGLDFGFNDPCALTWNKIFINKLFSSELIYRSGMTNADLSSEMERCGLVKHHDLIIADSEDTKSIEELFRMGWNIKPAKKGPDSVIVGIKKVNEYKQYWTKDSLNGIKEQRNYMYQKDKNDRYIDVPMKNGADHLMDSRRYAVYTVLSINKTIMGQIKF